MSALDLAALRALAERASKGNANPAFNPFWPQFSEATSPAAVLSLITAAERVPALEAENARLREALAELEGQASAIRRIGAKPGPQWVTFAGAILGARAALEPRS